MAIVSRRADESFVNLDDAAKLGLGFDKSGAYFVSHQPGGLTEPHPCSDEAGERSFPCCWSASGERP